MRAVSGEVTSSKPISLSKAAGVLSRFTASETDARPDVAACLRRAAVAFNELVSVLCDIRAHRKASHADQREGEDDNSHSKRKKKKGLSLADKTFTDNSTLEPLWQRSGGIKNVEHSGALLNERLESAMIEASGFAEVKKYEREKDEEKGSNIWSVIESNGVTGKKKEKNDRKNVVNVVRRYHKESKMKKSQVHENVEVGLISESLKKQIKKRNHPDA